MHVLVTGGAGYLGSVLTPLLLKKGHRVTAVDCLLHGGESLLGVLHDPNFTFIKADLRQIDAMPKILDGVDAVVHLAAIVGDPACARDPELAKATNLEASLKVYDLAKAKGVQRFLFASTCSNYGKMAEGAGFLNEDSPLSPVSLYAETKVGVEKALLNGRSHGGPAVTVLRCATLFGLSPRMRFDLTVNEFTRELIVQRKLIIFGKQFWRPYVHVRDVARLMAMVLEAPVENVAGQVFNAGDSNMNYQKQQLVEMVKAQIEFPVEIETVEKQEDPRDYRVSFDRVRERVGFAIECSVEDGIREIGTAIQRGFFTDAYNRRFQN